MSARPSTTDPAPDEPLDTTSDAAFDADGDGPVGGDRGQRRVSWSAALLIALLAAVVVGMAGTGIGWKLAQPTAVARDSVDAGYLQDMLLVLDQTAAITSEYTTRATNPELVKWARQEAIISQRLIGEHEARLADLGYTREDRPALSRGWMSSDMACVVQPGIAGDTELARWRRAVGTEADGRFVALLIPLKQQSAPMADVAAKRAQRPAVRDLAGRMARDQAASAQDLGASRTRLALPDYIGM